MLSIAIPTYEMKGNGVEFLKHQFDLFSAQTFKNFEIIISDHSRDSSISKLCQDYCGILDIHYHKNSAKLGCSSANINNAIRHCNGKIIKILFQDDFLNQNTALEQIYNSFDSETFWVVTGSIVQENNIKGHSMVPHYFDEIHLGRNTISSPSVLAIKNENLLFFDENLIYYMDVEYYKRLYTAFGPPKVVEQILTVNRLWYGQVQLTTSSETKKQELDYIKKLYDVGLYQNKLIPQLILKGQ